MIFHSVKTEDKETIDHYFHLLDSRHCDMCFSSVYLWACYYPSVYTVYEDMLIFKSEEDKISFSFPIGEGDPTKAVEKIMEYCKENEVSPAFHCLTRENEAFLEEHYPGLFEFEFDRGEAEYIYECEDLIALRGRKYHGKKNHVNKFKKSHEWTYEEMDDSNREECIQMLHDWKQENEDPADEEMGAEVCACKKAIQQQEELGLIGGLIRAEGRVVAFTIGERINSDTIVIHFEKAYSDIQGAYAIINQEFLIHHAGDARYVNREEDMGDPGLRKAKESYHPAFLEENGYAHIR